MKTKVITLSNSLFLPAIAAFLFFVLTGCERDLEDLAPAKYPANPEVFLQGFSSGLQYAAFGGSVPTAFDVDKEVTYNNSEVSMRIEVPDANDPRGAYAGGAYFTTTGRDLSGFTALTFWMKASQAATIDVLGLGNDMGASAFQVTALGTPVNTNWKKYYIPIPDPSRLTAERGMFFYSEGPENEKGYTFWIDELKFEALGTIAHPEFMILNGESLVETSFNGVTRVIDGRTATFNMPDGVPQTVYIAPAYYSFISSDPSIATVDASGNVKVVGGPGTARITALVGSDTARGSLVLNSLGSFQHAPIPQEDPADVISIFSDTYTNVPVNYYNGYWAPYQTTLSDDFEVEGDHILNYYNFNFVGIEFSSPTVNATDMSHLHLDLYIPEILTADAQMKIELLNQGAAGSAAFTTTIPASQSRKWVSLNIPFSSFSGLTSRDKLMQIIFVNENSKIGSFYADNIYFYDDGSLPPPPTEPTTPAPTPGYPAANVISIFSNAYTNVPGTDLNPNWGQATIVTQVSIVGNNTLKYAGLNYQGIQFGSSQNVSSMSFLHIDYWTVTSTSLKVFLISPGPVETSFVLPVPTTGWAGIDIPLSSFAPVNLNDVIQFKFEGNGDIYLDNLYFRK
jgi:hypothetical protein